jgi:hypothetical protein
MQRIYITLVMVCSIFGMTAVLYCYAAVWSGPQTKGQTVLMIFGGILYNAVALITVIGKCSDQVFVTINTRQI